MSYILISQLDDLIWYDEFMAEGDRSTDTFDTKEALVAAMANKSRMRDNLHKIDGNDYSFTIMEGRYLDREEVDSIMAAYDERLRQLGE